MPLHPEMRRILDTIGFNHAAELNSRSIEDAVRYLRTASPSQPAGLVTRCQDREIITARGPIPVRICWPDGDGPFPILLNFHGGGWVTGSVAGDDLRCQRLTVAAQCITISVDYSLAPEHPFPEGLDDCWQAVSWTFEHAHEISGDAARIAVSGASAGANLAAAIALRAVDAQKFLPMYQLLFYPVLDATARGGDIDGGPYYLSRDAMDWYWARYADPSVDRRNPMLSPLLATSLRGLPDACIITAELDPLAAEARAYSGALAAAGVTVEQHEMSGVVHGFLSFGPNLPASLCAMALAAAALRRAFYAHNDCVPIG